MLQLAQKNASALGAGHCFIVFLGEGCYPVNVLNAIKMVPKVSRVFCATANPVEVIVAETDQGRGVLGVIDGFPPEGIVRSFALNCQFRFAAIASILPIAYGLRCRRHARRPRLARCKSIHQADIRSGEIQNRI